MSASPKVVNIPEKFRGKWLLYTGPDYEDAQFVTEEILSCAEDGDLTCHDSLEEANERYRKTLTGMVGPIPCQIFDPEGNRHFD